jgi:flagellar hook-basal body complex protein FliE
MTFTSGTAASQAHQGSCAASRNDRCGSKATACRGAESRPPSGAAGKADFGSALRSAMKSVSDSQNEATQMQNELPRQLDRTS